jgi:hypothetical protein
MRLMFQRYLELGIVNRLVQYKIVTSALPQLPVIRWFKYFVA